MNDKLKQSLQGRLDGMRWGEREQAEVFRQIRKKEMQDVKQIKRGSGLLAMAVVLLFLVMGSAYAVTQRPQAEDKTRLSQNPQTTFLPAAVVQVENEYITLTVDNATWDGANAAFEATIRLKEPDKYALSIDGYSNPGGEGREVLNVSLSAQSVLSTEQFYQAYSVFNLPELLNMTEDSATIRMSGKMALEGQDSIDFSLWLAAEGSQTSFIAELPFTFRQSGPDAVADHRRLLFSNDLLKGYLIAARHAGTSALLTIELEPAKPWYAIGDDTPGKSDLLVTASDATACETASTRALATAPMNIAAQDGIARASAILSLPDAQAHLTLRCEITATDPVTGSSVTQPVTMTVSSLERQQAAEVTPSPAPAEATAAPQPSVTPAPTALPAPTGKVLGGSDIVTVWLEKSWYDGLSAEATLRIRADDPTHRLALRPNESGAPSDSTWVVEAESRLNADYWTPLTYTLTREESTGDILIHLTYKDLTDSQRRQPSGQLYPLTIPLTITATSERSWDRSSAEVTVSLETPEMEDIQPLYLVEGSGADVFVQGSMLTTDRYRYIGVMLSPGSYGIPAVHLLDANGTVHVTDGHSNVDGNSLLVFPRVLFPYEGDKESQFILLTLRLDKDVPLPETLPVTIMQQRNNNVSRQAVLHLSTEPHDMAECTLIDGQYASVVLTNVSTGEGWTTGRLRIDLKDPRAYSLVNYGPDHPADHLSVNVKLTAMSVGEDGSLRSMGSFKLLSTDGSHSNRQEYFFTGDTAEGAASDARTVLAEMSVQDADGVTLETRSATIALPRRGGVTRYRLVRTEDTPMANLEYHSGTLLVSPDACYAEMTYRCTGNCTQANFIPYTDGERLDYRLRYIDAYPELKEPIKITQLWWEPDGPVPETIDFIVEDANHSPHPEIARFTVRVEPIGE